MDEKSTESLKLLEQRAKRCVCKYCGSELEVRLVVFGKFIEATAEIFCPICNKIEYGVEQEIYYNAQYFVNTLGFNIYPDREINRITKQLNIAKVCEIMEWNERRLGFLDDSGFLVQPQKNDFLTDSSDGSIIFNVEVSSDGDDVK